MLYKKLSKNLPKWLHVFIFTWATNSIMYSSTTSSYFEIISFQNIGYSNGCAPEPQHHFNSHFPKDTWCRICFHMLLLNLNMFMKDRTKLYDILKSGCSFIFEFIPAVWANGITYDVTTHNFSLILYRDFSFSWRCCFT